MVELELGRLSERGPSGSGRRTLGPGRSSLGRPSSRRGSLLLCPLLGLQSLTLGRVVLREARVRVGRAERAAGSGGGLLAGRICLSLGGDGGESGREPTCDLRDSSCGRDDGDESADVSLSAETLDPVAGGEEGVEPLDQRRVPSEQRRHSVNDARGVDAEVRRRRGQDR